MFSFAALSVAALRQRFLAYHEHAIGSSLATVNRYRAATSHLQNFAPQQLAHRVDAEEFLRYLRSLRVAPNGHPRAKRRPLREKGIRFILETCRSMYGYAAKKRHLPPYFEICFAPRALRRRQNEDAKPIFVFDADQELAFLTACSNWAFPIFFALAQTGLRPGELIHSLAEDLDLDGGWWHIRNKPALGWCVKTRANEPFPSLQNLSTYCDMQWLAG